MQTDPPKAEQVLIEPKLYVEKSTNGWPIMLKKQIFTSVFGS